MKSIPFGASVAALILSFSSASAQTTWYSTGNTTDLTSTNYWNSNADGTSGSNGTATTYNEGTNDLIIRTGDTMRGTLRVADSTTTWNFNSLTLQDGSMLTQGQLDTFMSVNGGDVTIQGTATYDRGFNGTAGNSNGGIIGTSDMILTSGNTFKLTPRKLGNFEFGLNIVGDGLLDIGSTQTSTVVSLTGLSTDFTGEVEMRKVNHTLAISEGVQHSFFLDLGRDLNTTTATLDLGGIGDVFSVGSLNVSDQSIASGIYTKAELDTLVRDLLDDQTAISRFAGDGELYVGVAIPEPGTYALLGGICALGAVMLRRRQ